MDELSFEEKRRLLYELEEIAERYGLRQFDKVAYDALVASVVTKDGSVALTADWDVGDGRMIQADEVRARDGDGLKLFEDGGTGVFVKDGGNVGVGTVTPSNKLDVNGNIGFGNGARAFGLDGTRLAFDRGGSYYTGFDLLVGASDGLTVYSNGNVGIGSVVPTSKLQVVGLPVYTTNALALAGGLTAGAFYRTGGDPDVVCVVH